MKIVACDICTEENHGNPTGAQRARWTFTVYGTDVKDGKPTNPRTPNKVVDGCEAHHRQASESAIRHASKMGNPTNVGGSVHQGNAFDHIDVRAHAR